MENSYLKAEMAVGSAERCLFYTHSAHIWNGVMYREGQPGRYLECRGHYLESLWCISGTTNQMGSLECQYFASANKMHSLAPQKFLVG